VAAALPEALLVATTGYTSRELYAVADSARCFYMQGSMGHAAAFGLGVAETVGKRRNVVVLDGDGAALMHLGTFATIGAAAPPNLIHILLDNGRYESTGGQPTSARASFADAARALGYRRAWTCDGAAEVQRALRAAQAEPGPTLLAVRIQPVAGGAPPRATSAISAPEILHRFADEAGRFAA
jgi:phosphonopyruvate decarboxylase